ncbi:MAG: trypsin-like peptidase domain-containing protein [Roseicyclus sp.]|nr:trypsin-like peptidase domain-containing protein [Roseicyclus sp.]
MAKNPDTGTIQRMMRSSQRLQGHLAEISRAEADIMAASREILGIEESDPTTTFHASPRLSTGKPLLERHIGPTSDIVSIEFLEAGLLAKRPVGRIWDGGQGFSTGFLVGHGLIMTAAHCLHSEAEASDLVFQLDLEAHTLGAPVPVREYSLDPGRFFFRDEDHDIAICAVTDFTGLEPTVESFGWHVLSSEDEVVTARTPVSIIQHPKGRAKSLVVHNSHFVDCGKTSNDDRFCWYSGDTEQGSSGAPVFRPDWRVLAVHRSAIPARTEDGVLMDRNGNPVIRSGQYVRELSELDDLDDLLFAANEGVRASRIVARLSDEEMATPDQERLRRMLLDIWSRPGAARIARKATASGLTASI